MEHLGQLEVAVLFGAGHVVEMAFLPSGPDIEQTPEDPLDLIDFGRIDEFGNAEVALVPKCFRLLLAESQVRGLLHQLPMNIEWECLAKNRVQHRHRVLR
jgi:hypothetical protein